MTAQVLRRLRRLLLDARLAAVSPAHGGLDAPRFRNTFDEVCSIALDENAYEDLWDEPVLLQLQWLFTARPPSPVQFAGKLELLKRRAEEVSLVNDLFFGILDSATTAEALHGRLIRLSGQAEALLPDLLSTDRLGEIRRSTAAPSTKIDGFLSYLREHAGLALTDKREVARTLEALKQAEAPGIVNALLVAPEASDGLVVPLEVKVQAGHGEVRPAIRTSEELRAVLDRARLALQDAGYLQQAVDVIYWLEATTPLYTGTSLGLPAAVAILGASRKNPIDRYTAFTGDINLEKSQWRVLQVDGLTAKIQAARLDGCRRIFVPGDNAATFDRSAFPDITIVPVDDLVATFVRLDAGAGTLSSSSLAQRKLSTIVSFSRSKGWPLSDPRPIPKGVQVRVTPLHLPELAITVYDSGAHAPARHDQAEYSQLLAELEAPATSRTPIRRVEQSLNVTDRATRAGIREALDRLGPASRREEPHCEYSFRFERGREHLVVKQYSNGKLQLQGSAGDLYGEILEAVLCEYDLRNPAARISMEGLVPGAADGHRTPEVVGQAPHPAIPLPYIGTDESGKGDYFGPMVVAAVLLDEASQRELAALGVKDSKLLSDQRVRQLAAEIRRVCRGKYVEVEIPPERYNELYDEMRREGKTLNHLLAWGHARALESLLARWPSSYAVADQFGDEHYIKSKLMERGRRLELVQLPKGERYLAVAAASVLARDRFLDRLGRLSAGHGVSLPKGASDSVVQAAKMIVKRFGSDRLRRVAKLHHKTTKKVLE